MGKPFHLVGHENRWRARCGQQSVDPWSDLKPPTGQKENHRAIRWTSSCCFPIEKCGFRISNLLSTPLPNFPCRKAHYYQTLISSNSQRRAQSGSSTLLCAIMEIKEWWKQTPKLNLHLPFKKTRPFALYTNSVRVSSTRENIGRFVKYFINTNAVKEIMKQLKWKENASLMTASLAFQI